MTAAGLPRPGPYQAATSHEPLGRVTFANTGHGRDFHAVLRDKDGIVFGVIFGVEGVGVTEVHATAQLLVDQGEELATLKAGQAQDEEVGTRGERALEILRDASRQRLETTVWRGLFRKPDKVYTLPTAIWSRIVNLLWEDLQRK